MSHSLEWNCRQVVMQILAADSRLSSFPIKEFESDITTSALLDQLVVKAEKGEKQLEGPGCYLVTMTVNYATGTATEAAADVIAAAISESIYSGNFSGSINDLKFFSIEPGGETVIENLDKVKRRLVRFPVLATI